jgi:hypothetical protein
MGGLLSAGVFHVPRACRCLYKNMHLPRSCYRNARSWLYLASGLWEAGAGQRRVSWPRVFPKTVS